MVLVKRSAPRVWQACTHIDNGRLILDHRARYQCSSGREMTRVGIRFILISPNRNPLSNPNTQDQTRKKGPDDAADFNSSEGRRGFFDTCAPYPSSCHDIVFSEFRRVRDRTRFHAGVERLRVISSAVLLMSCRRTSTRGVSKDIVPWLGF